MLWSLDLEFANLKTGPTRFIARCKAEGCPWRIHALRIYDGKTIEVQPVSFLFFYSKLSMVYFCNMYSILLQIKVLPAEHNCPTTKRREGKMATQDWCASRLTEWLKKNPNKCPKDARDKLEDDYGIKLKYSKAWAGMKLALQHIHGTYEESFQLLVNWKAQMELISPGSIVEIEVEGNKK